VPDFVSRYTHLKVDEKIESVEVRIGARIISMRSYGPSLHFYICKGDGVTVQILCDQREATGLDVERFKEHHKLFRTGDIIGVIGFPGRATARDQTREQGALSVYAREVILLTPCLRPVCIEISISITWYESLQDLVLTIFVR
jgi:lysyl-tRNA synthetase class 2